MANPEEQAPGGEHGAGMRKRPAKPVPLGTDVALAVPTAGGEPLRLSYWDLWFALVATKEHGGDLARLADHLNDSIRAQLHGRESVRRKRAHIRELKARLITTGQSAEQIVAAAGELARKELSRARRRVLEPTEREGELSEPMRQNPKQQRFAQALRGHWSRFPVSPEPVAAEIWSHFRTKRYYTEDQSFGIVRKLDRYLDRAERFLAAGQYADAQALLRAFLTVVIELMEVADDSYGSIGDAFHQAFKTYLGVELAKTGIEEATFFADLLLLLIWEDYGLTWRQTDGYFRQSGSTQADWIIGFLRTQIEELRADDLECQAEEALTLLSQVVAEQRRFEQFESLAREMGSRHWERVIRLADTAVKQRKQPLACLVFEAALTPGPHQDFLMKKYEQLKQGRWNPDPRG